MFLNKWFGQPSTSASNDSQTIDGLRRGRGTRRRKFQPRSWEVLEARQLLAHTTIAPGVAEHPAAAAGLTPEASRTPTVDRALEESFLKGVDQQYLGIAASPRHIVPYLRMLEQGVPRVRVLSRLLESPAARFRAMVAVRLRGFSSMPASPTSRERGSLAEELDRGGDLRTLLVSIASSREYYVSTRGPARFRDALKADLLGLTTPGPRLPGDARRPDRRARSSLAHALVFSRAFAEGVLAAVADRRSRAPTCRTRA